MTLYNIQVGEKSGTDALPHPEFWASVLSLVVDGIGYAMKKDKGEPVTTRTAGPGTYCDIYILMCH
jgi:hypothetical protein